MNRQAKKHHLISFELLQLLIDEQGSTLIQQATNDLRIKNNNYGEGQLCITVLTAEYDGGTRTIERFLKAVAYDVIELFVYAQSNQQKLVYRGRCYTLKRTNRNDTCWICASAFKTPGKLHTSLDATEVIHTSEHAEGCRLAAEYPRPVWEIYDELTSSAFTSLDTAAYFLSWDQAQNTMYYSRAKRYPRLLAKRQDLRLMPSRQQQNLAGVRLLAQSTCWCGNGAFKIVPSWYQQLFTLHLRILEVLHSKAEKFEVQLDPARYQLFKAFFQIPGYKVFASTFAKLCFSMSAGLA
ncbi:hypothetical protein T4E_11173 [Trichinella pseudospiralis]|uniref:FLYWCH-type domain-containing protein n=1 Tax=Trichinella pseudospiralis TaxID=6337 RepID=A0A0V0XHI4_TRIPS|nr:hypothetical protein T4E_11173 [Trichinella pseudospiralis]